MEYLKKKKLNCFILEKGCLIGVRMATTDYWQITPTSTKTQKKNL